MMRTHLEIKRWILRRLAERRLWLVNSLVALLLISAVTQPLRAQAWQVETVDDGKGDNVGQYASLVIDKAGSIHIAYYDETQRSLRYAFRASRGDERQRRTTRAQPEHVAKTTIDDPPANQVHLCTEASHALSEHVVKAPIDRSLPTI